MNSIISYIIELNITITIFYFVYKMIFRQDANFSLRRGFLLYAMLISVLLPFLNFSFPENRTAAGIPIFTIDEVVALGGGNNFVSKTAFNLEYILELMYFSVTSYFLLRLVISIMMILRTAVKSEISAIGNHLVRNSKRLHASSFFNYIFINVEESEKNDLPHIIEHESQHARLGHSFDRLLTEILLVLGWINPFTWLLRKAVVINHEYQADNRMIEQGTDHVSYQLTILNQYIGSASITNQFSNHIKNRIVMLNKNYKKGSFWKSLVLFPLSIILLFFIACGNDDKIDEESLQKSAENEVFYVVEEMPEWPGEEDFSMAMRKFIATNLAYPKKAKENGAEGKVFITFIVSNTGEVLIPEPEMLSPDKHGKGELNEVVVAAYRKLNDDAQMPDEEYIDMLKKEGQRVVGLIPDLIPGKQRGVPVNVAFTIPITYKLQ